MCSLASKRELMRRIGKFFAAMIKGTYDILASYLLVTTLIIVALSLGLHAVAALVAQSLDQDSLELMWRRLSWKIGFSSLSIRLTLFIGAQLLLVWLLKGPLGAAFHWGERGVDKVQRAYLWLGQRLPAFKRAFSVVFTLAVTAVLIPFIIQPSLVGMRADKRAWLERAANLADGSAALAINDDVVGFYRRLYAKPVVPKEKLDQKTLNDAFSQRDGQDSQDAYGPLAAPQDGGKEPFMDRWDPIIWKAAKQDAKRFAQVKAFMYVESGGRQFALSHTGCAGLMQFCSRTAKAPPFRDIFGTGQIYACGCSESRCKVERQVQRELERGDLSIIERYKSEFPCEITDARFNPTKAIFAGEAYVAKLNASLGGNMYLMYIGYNSGPRVAQEVFSRLGNKSDATLAEIEAELTEALRPYYNDSAEARARSLTRTHLPKIQGAFERYHRQAQQPKADAAAQQTP